jgi:xanthine dehydrogenase/oxidase
MKTEETLRVYVNDKIILDSPDPTESLIHFLRRHGFTGTKLGCSEGGCGSCTVIVSDGTTINTLNSCLTNACAVHQKHVITIEGLGTQKNLNLIQKTLMETHSRYNSLIVASVGFAPLE